LCAAAWVAQDDPATGARGTPDDAAPHWVVESADDAARDAVHALQLA
jgi:hypothetical protein